MTQAEKIKQQITEKKQQVPEKQKEKKTLQTMLEQMKPEIRKALPKHLDEERMVRLLMTAVRSNPKLQQADPISFIAAGMEAAQIGLEPNTSLGECYIIPYYNKKEGKYYAEFQMGYKGILKLAHNTGEYKSVYAHPVYANDEFHYQYGLSKDLVHIPADIPDGDPIYYYSVYHLKNGGFDFKVMSRESVQIHAKKYSPGAKFGNGPWSTDFDSMALKTVLLAALKYAPKAIEVAKAVEYDGTTKTDIAADMSDVIDMRYKELEAKEEDQPYNASSDEQ